MTEHRQGRVEEIPERPTLEELWHRHHASLCYFVRRIMGAGEHVEDTVQEIMLKLHRSLPRYDGRRGSVSGWLYTIARNHCRDLRRRSRTVPFHRDGEIDLDRLPASSGTGALAQPEEALLSAEDRGMVDRFMEGLAPNDRSILFLRFYEDLSYRDIGEILGRPEGTIRYRVHELKKQLAEHVRIES